MSLYIIYYHNEKHLNLDKIVYGHVSVNSCQCGEHVNGQLANTKLCTLKLMTRRYVYTQYTHIYSGSQTSDVPEKTVF